jgi:hypothetical protein
VDPGTRRPLQVSKLPPGGGVAHPRADMAAELCSDRRATRLATMNEGRNIVADLADADGGEDSGISGGDDSIPPLLNALGVDRRVWGRHHPTGSSSVASSDCPKVNSLKPDVRAKLRRINNAQEDAAMHASKWPAAAGHYLWWTFLAHWKFIVCYLVAVYAGLAIEGLLNH